MRLLAVVFLATSGCFFGWGGDDTPGDDDMPDEPQPAIVVAVGASVTPILETSICDHPRFNHLCFEGSLHDLVDVTIDSTDVFTIGPVTEDDYDIVLPITAHRAGDAYLTFHMQNIIRSESVQVLIRAAELETASIAASCTDAAVDADDTLGITPGTSVRFEVVAMAGEQRLLTGGMELVTAPGFTLTPASDQTRQATAPTVPGDYEWQVQAGAPTRFVVYDVAELVPVLVRRTNDEIYVEGRVGTDVKVCVHGRKERAMVEVASGSCRPSFSYVDVEGPMPIALGGDFATTSPSFNLVSDVEETCTLTARVESTGSMTSATFDASVVPPTQLPMGSVIDTNPQVFNPPAISGSDCGGSATDGDCDGVLEYPPIPVDGDCYIDSDWEYQFVDGSRVIGDNDFVGVGLQTQFRLKVVAEILGLIPFDVGPPQNLSLTYSTDELEIASVGCTANNEEVLTVKALSSASIVGHNLDFTASNLDDEGEYRVRAKNIDRVTWGGKAGGDIYYWEHTAAGFAPAYYSGSQELYGKGAYSIQTHLGSPVLANGGISGNAGDAVLLRSLVGTNLSQRVHFVDDTSVTSIANFTFNEVASIDTNLCTTPVPSVGSSTGEIHGQGPKGRLSLTGNAFTMGYDQQGKLCLYAYAEGASNVTLRWGTHSQTRSWRVDDPFSF